MIKHTAGPWKENQYSAGYEIYGGEHSKLVASVAVRRHDDPEGRANSLLIAAAPELLEALEKCKEAMQAHMKRYGPTPNIVTAENIAADVLAKVRP